jgi:proline iminopeptidase
MATTIDASPSTIWPWLVQMGLGRAGWYSYDRLDNAGVMSAERVLPQLQELRVGDRIDATSGGRTWFEVAELEPERHLVLRACIDLLRRRSYDSVAPRPRWFSDSTWEFVLEPLPDGRTRLVVGGSYAGRPRVLTRLAGLVFWEPAHAVMERKQLRGLARRAERSRRSILQPAPTVTRR